METTNNITPTKESPVFVAYNDYLGRIERSLYKEWEIKEKDCWSCGTTFALRFTDAIVELHKWIQDNEAFINEYPKSNFYIEVVNGSIDKKGNVVHTKVYSITAKKAKQYLF